MKADGTFKENSNPKTNTNDGKPPSSFEACCRGAPEVVEACYTYCDHKKMNAGTVGLASLSRYACDEQES